MIIDAFVEFSAAQALTATALGTNVLDLGTASPVSGLGSGEPMCVAFEVIVAAKTSNNDETYQFDIVGSASANLGSSTSLDSRTIARATLVAGYKFYIPVGPGVITQRYFGVNYTLGGTSPTITVTAHLQPMAMIQTDKVYAKGYTIL